MPTTCALTFREYSAQRQVYRCCYPARIIPAGDGPSAAAQFLASIPHDNRMSLKLKHFNVVMIITNGHYLFATVATILRPSLQRVSLLATWVHHIDNRDIPYGLLRAKD